MYFPEDSIVTQNEQGKALFFLEKGNLSVFVSEDGKVKRRYVRSLPVGAMFGEIGVVFQCKRTASVVSKNYST